jgi:hypothetical protein
MKHKKKLNKVLKQGLQVLFHIVMAKFPIPENCSTYVPMILKEFCSSKLWELCPFELRNVSIFTTEAACQRNSSETTEQNFMKPCRYKINGLVMKTFSGK